MDVELAAVVIPVELFAVAPLKSELPKAQLRHRKRFRTALASPSVYPRLTLAIVVADWDPAVNIPLANCWGSRLTDTRSP